MNRKALAAILVAVILIAGFSIFRGRRTPPNYGTIIVQGVADVAVEEIAKLAGPNAKIIFIQGKGDGLIPDPPEVARFPEQFSEAAEKKGMMRILSTEKIYTYGSDLSDLPKGAPIPSSAKSPVPMLPWDIYAATIQKHSGADVLVSMIGPPRVTPQDKALWAAQTTKVVVLMMAGDPRPTKVALKTGAAKLAILPRNTGAPLGERLPTSPRAWFDSQYQVLTPQTVDQMK